MEEQRKWRIVVCVLLAACFLLPGMGNMVQSAVAEDVEPVDHSVWVDGGRF